jgi:hypothetical protein
MFMDWGFFFGENIISAIFTFIVRSIGSINMDWGSFWGSVIGAVTTFIAFLFTYRLSKKENKNTQQEMQEQNRLAVLPYLSATFYSINAKCKIGVGDVIDLNDSCLRLHSNSDIDTDFCSKINREDFSNLILFKLRNLGKGPAVNCKLSLIKHNDAVPICDLLSGEEYSFFVLIPKSGSPYPYDFKITFCDVQLRAYTQKMSLLYGHIFENGKPKSSILIKKPLSVPTPDEKNYNDNSVCDIQIPNLSCNTLQPTHQR